MLTKKKLIQLAVAFGLMVAFPAWFILAGCNKWISAAALCFSCAIIFIMTLKYGSIITSAFHIVIRAVKNRLFGYKSADKVYPLISKEQRSQIDNALKISFTGDLILLREMIERAYNNETGNYEFDAMFEHVRDIWKNSDLSIGVFEGPLCGAEYGYSTSNFDDNVPLALNFPDSFAESVKKAGINLVSLANNHIFDMGIEGGLRTPDILDKIGLDHVGFFKDKDSFHKPKIIKLHGKKIGILAYTYGQNGKGDDFYFGKTPDYYVKPVLSIDSKYFKQNVELVKADFEAMKAEHPDLIIVLPHMGTQFLSKPDKTQRKWCRIFADLGADIIFADHPHHVQPIEWLINKDGKRVLTVYCPGNFINSYVGYDGDASMIVSAYLDRDSLNPFAVSVIPIYAHCPQNGMWTGLPTYKALTDHKLYNSLSRADFRRINHANRLVTGIALGAPLDADVAQKEYISFPDTGFVRQLLPPYNVNTQGYSSLINAIAKSSTICFLGDSLTDGTKNGGFGWYEPLMANFPDKNVLRFAEGSRTSRWLLDNASNIAKIDAELFVVAIGCNDIRYRNPQVCAMTAAEFISNLDRLVKTIKEANPDVNFAFVAPWRSLHFDANFNVSSQSERMKIYSEYTLALSDFCHQYGYLFLDPNPFLFQDMLTPDIRLSDGNDILKDFIHPNAYTGIAAYSKAVVQCCQTRNK